MAKEHRSVTSRVVPEHPPWRCPRCRSEFTSPGRRTFRRGWDRVREIQWVCPLCLAELGPRRKA